MSIMEHICPSLIYVTVSVYRLPMFAGGHDNLIDAARALSLLLIHDLAKISRSGSDQACTRTLTRNDRTAENPQPYKKNDDSALINGCSWVLDNKL